MRFAEQKAKILADLGRARDRSPKGSLDEPIRCLVNDINRHADYVTTSSCSGRISLFHVLADGTSGDASHYELPKKGLGTWLLAKHAKLDVHPCELSQALAGRQGFVTLKHEPFVMHILCRTLAAAQVLLQVAHRCGFRESGISAGKKKTMLAIRTAANVLEVPLVCNGDLLVSERYLQVLARIANAKFDENLRRTQLLHSTLLAQVLQVREEGEGVWRALRLVEGETEWLVRRGNSATVVSGKVLVFGGYGNGSTRKGTHQRLNDVVVLTSAQDDPDSFALYKPVVVNQPPSPRLRHSAAKVDNALVVFGGRESPLVALNDVHVLVEVGALEYMWATCNVPNENAPAKRWSHVASDGLTLDGTSSMVVFGGRNEESVFGDTWIFALSSQADGTYNGTWVQPNISGELPCPRFLHGSCTSGQKLVVYGGYRSLLSSHLMQLPILDCVYVLDASMGSSKQLRWSQVKTNVRFPRFSHQMIPWGDGRALVFGGFCPNLFTGKITQLLNYERGTWEAIDTSDKYGDWAQNANRMFLSFTAVSLGRHTLILGGGALCFSFGSRFNQPCAATFKKQSAKPIRTNKETPARSSGELETRKMEITPEYNAEPMLNAVLASRQGAKTLKSFLEKKGWYDKSRRIAGYLDTESLAIPLNDAGVANLLLDTSEQYTLVSLTLPPARHMLRPESKQGMKFMREKITAILRMECPEVDVDEIAKEIPAKIELLDDVAIIPTEAFSSCSVWRKVFALGERSTELCIWRIISEHTGSRRVVLANRVDPGKMRESQAQVVYPRTGEKTCVVKVKQNQIIYRFDITKCMFSSGNITEKQRVARFSCHNEVVVDMFAGIGYFTLPYLVHAKAAHVHACEWNPNAVTALRDNLKLNKVEEKCTVHVGDNKETCKSLYATADRVNLGLIPSSESAWETALRLLKPSGGWLHIHENVDKGGVHEWKKYLLSRLHDLSSRSGFDWRITCKHIERVKSYAPKLLHVVADIHCTQSTVMPTPRMADVFPRAKCQIQYRKLPATKEEAAGLFSSRQPIVFTDAFEWDLAEFQLALESRNTLGQRQVSIHVGDAETRGLLSFVKKNFEFKCLPLQEAVQMCQANAGQFCYLRSVGSNPRKDRADFWKDYPGMGEQLGFPSKKEVEMFCAGSGKVFSSVFRMASPGLQLWTHYDVMDNILFQTVGTKRILLYHLEDVEGLYLDGSSSPITDVDDTTNPQFPLYAQARSHAEEITLHAGQALFIPALWPHNVRSKDFSLAVNCFWRSLPSAMYSEKDLYGNRDPKVIERSYELIHQARQAMETDIDGNYLPNDFLTFYKRKAISAFLGQDSG